MNTLIEPTATNVTRLEAASRLDLYRPIHQALRAAMAQSLLALGALDPEDAAERSQVFGRLALVLTILESHLRHEEEFLHPVLLAAGRGLVASIEMEHNEHRADIAALRTELAALEAEPSDARMAALYRHMALFVAENHAHMHTEETRFNALLWARHSDDELLAIQERLIASIPGEELMATLEFMLPALNPAQRAGLLLDMRAKAPAPAFAGVLALAERVLVPRAWARLQADLA
jgi:hemerythrin-like domain-containing protein